MIRSTTRQVVDLQPDMSLTVLRTGAGRSVLLLHGGGGPDSITAIVDRYADRHHVLAPVHPGWAGTAQPARFDSVATLALTYLDLLARLDLTEVVVIGSSFGGWVAAEMAIHQTGHHVAAVVLLNAAGPQLQPHHLPDHTQSPSDATPDAARHVRPRLRERVPARRVPLVPRAGHLPFLDQPDLTVRCHGPVPPNTAQPLLATATTRITS